MIPKIILKSGRDVAVKRFHPWVFSGAVAQTIGEIEDGDIVEIQDFNKNYLATGHYFDGSIVVKILDYVQVEINLDFWVDKLQNANQLRQKLGLIDTNCYRMVHGEGDGLPGLIIDIYNGVAVVQAHSVGMYRAMSNISLALQHIFGQNLKAIYNKSAETLPDKYGKNIENGYLFGNCNVPHAVLENGNKFLIDWITGQKTGFFIDQRDNRALLSRYAQNKRVLNTFCYSGGFSVYALAAGATEVHSVDVSKKAIELTNQNVETNFGNISNHQSYAEDVMPFLKNSTENYDVIILDPPAFAKNIAAKHRATQGYKRLNIEGMKKLSPKGILFTFSCSQVIDRDLFYNTVVAAAIEVGRRVRVLHQITQPADHPVSIFHPEGSYLKGLVLEVE